MVCVETISRVPALAPSRSDVLYGSNGDGAIDSRPHTSPLGGRSKDSPKRRDVGRAPVSSAPPRTPRRIRPPPRQPKAIPGNCRKRGMYGLPRCTKNRHPTTSTPQNEPRLGDSFVGGGYDEEETLTLRRGPDYVGGCSAVVASESGVCGGASLDDGTPAFAATRPDEAAADGMMHGGLLWRESGVGRETELATDGVPQGFEEACRPVREKR